MPSKAERTRAAILQVALERFSERGYDGTRLSDIADQLGLTRAALYYHFRSKDDLLVALVEPYLDAIDALVSGAAAPLSPAERRCLIQALADLLVRDIHLLRWIDRDPAVRVHPRLGGRRAAQDDAIRRLLAPTDDDRGLVQAAAALGALRRPLAVLDEIDPVQARDQVVAAALELLDAHADGD